MKVVEVLESEKDNYNRFVMDNESGSFLQSWEWGGWQSALGRQVTRLKFQVESGETIGIIQLVRMPLPFGKYYLYCPYGPVTLALPSPIGRGEGDRVNFKSITNDLISKFSDAVFIRIEPKDASLFSRHYPLATKSPNIQPAKTLIIDLSKNGEQLLSEMHPKTRYNIKVAQKHGVEIKDEFDITIGHGLFAKEAMELIVKTAKRQTYKGYGPEYYQKMIDCLAMRSFLSSRPSLNVMPTADLPKGLTSEGEWREPSSSENMAVKGFLGSDALARNDNTLKLHIYKAIYNNQLLASAIMIDFGKIRTFLFGGSSENNKNVMAPYLMHWQAMLDAKHAGLSQYDFWGVETSSGEVPGFVRFKLGFGGKTLAYLGAYDIVNNKFLYTCYKILRRVKRFY